MQTPSADRQLIAKRPHSFREAMSIRCVRLRNPRSTDTITTEEWLGYPSDELSRKRYSPSSTKFVKDKILFFSRGN